MAFCPSCGSRVVVSTVPQESGLPPPPPPSASPPPPPAVSPIPEGQERYEASANTDSRGSDSLAARNEEEESDRRESVSRSYASSRPSAGRTLGKIVAAIAVVILFLMLVPLPLPFNTTLQSYAVDVSRSQLASSNCVSVSGSWSTSNGGSVTFAIVNATGTVVYSADASSGSFSFGGFSGPYMAGAYSILPETVQVSGTCWDPVMNIGLP